MKVLLVEDDIHLANNLALALKREGFVADCVHTGANAIDQFSALPADMVILDLGLPDMDGTEVLVRLRRLSQQVPVLILTARDQTQQIVAALDKGADDYLSKPFQLPELFARLRALGRRVNQTLSNVITVGELSIDTTALAVSYQQQPISLSRREYMLLKALMENLGRVLTKESLENKLYSWGEEVASNTIEVHISNLRKKLPQGYIQTIRGVGYSMAKQPTGSTL